MEPEPEKLDLSALDPAAHPGWDRKVAGVAARAIELRRLRRAVVRRGAVAVVLAAAAAVALWLSAPHHEPPPRPQRSMLDWAVRDVSASELLEIGAGDAQ